MRPPSESSPQDRESPHLVAVNGAHRGSIFVLGRKAITLGRDAEADIVVEHEGASRNHATIEPGDGAYALRDLGSKNGTWFQGLMRGESRTLRDGDRFRIGGAQFLFFDPLGLATPDAVPGRALRPRGARRRVLRVASPIFFSQSRVDGSGLLYDISETGARIVGHSVAVNLDAAVRIVVSMGPVEDGLVLRGRVVRVSDSGFAVKFIGASGRLRKILGELSAGPDA